eukprot:UN32328
MRSYLLLLLFGALLAFSDGPGDREWNPEDKFCGELNCYEILDIAESSTTKEIKPEKNELSKLYHPDKNDSEEAKEIIKNVNSAWEVLKSEERRKQYDAMLRVRRALDAPQENVIIVGLLIFGILTFIVTQYKKENYRQVKRSIIEKST